MAESWIYDFLSIVAQYRNVIVLILIFIVLSTMVPGVALTILVTYSCVYEPQLMKIYLKSLQYRLRNAFSNASSNYFKGGVILIAIVLLFFILGTIYPNSFLGQCKTRVVTYLSRAILSEESPNQESLQSSSESYFPFGTFFSEDPTSTLNDYPSNVDSSAMEEPHEKKNFFDLDYLKS